MTSSSRQARAIARGCSLAVRLAVRLAVLLAMVLHSACVPRDGASVDAGTPVNAARGLGELCAANECAAGLACQAGVCVSSDEDVDAGDDDRSLGASCERSADCDSALCSPDAICVANECDIADGDGEGDGGEGEALDVCAFGLVCSGGPCGRSCEVPAALREPCLFRSDDNACPTSTTCAEGLVCALADFGESADGECAFATNRPLDAPCDSDGVCAPGLVCNAARRCRVGIGGACAENQQCGSGVCTWRGCAVTTCEDGCGLAEACTASPGCTRTCDPLVVRGGLCGVSYDSDVSACSYERACVGDLACIANPLAGGVVVPFECAPVDDRDVGELCTSDDDCTTGLRCEATTARCA